MKISLIITFQLLFIFFCSSCHYNGSTRQDALSYFEKGKHFEENNDIRNALINYWEAIDRLSLQNDTIQKADVYVRLGDLLYRYGLYEKAVLNHREGYALLKNEKDNHRLWQVAKRLSYDYSILNQPDTAVYFQKIADHLSVNINQPSLQQALPPFVQSAPDSIANVYEREELLHLENKYKREKAISQQIKARQRQLVLLSLFGSVLCILLVSLFVIYRKKEKTEKQKKLQLTWFHEHVKANQKELESYRRDLSESNMTINKLRRELAHMNETTEEARLLRKEIENHNQRQRALSEKEKQLRLIDEQLLSANSTQAVLWINQMKKTPIYNPIRNERERTMLIEFVHLLYGDFKEGIDRLGELSEREKEICYLAKLGFSTGQLAIFYGISPGSVTKAKFRIKKKAESVNSNRCPYPILDFI